MRASRGSVQAATGVVWTCLNSAWSVHLTRQLLRRTRERSRVQAQIREGWYVDVVTAFPAGREELDWPETSHVEFFLFSPAAELPKIKINLSSIK